MSENDDKLVNEINEMFHTLHQKEDEYRALFGPIPALSSRVNETDEKQLNTYTVTVSGTVLICRNIEATSAEEACKIVEDNWVDMDFETEVGDYGGYEAEEEES